MPMTSAERDPSIDAKAATRGILWMLATVLMFACINATAKLLTQSYPVWQVVWARYAFQFLLIAVYLGPRLGKVAATGRLRLQLIRSLLLFGTTILFFTGLSLVPLADATAIMFVAPILVTALSMPLLGEHVGPRRWAGVAIGFLGALIVIRPGFGLAQSAALLPLGAACFHAFYQISTRMLSRSDETITTLFYTATTGALIASLVAPFHWTMPDAAGWSMMAALGLFATLGHFCLIKAFTSAPAATVSPFGYVNLLWATLFGYLLFAHLPDPWTLTGAAIIILSGLYIYRRERAKGAANRQAEPPT